VGNSEGLGDVAVRFLFDQRESGHQAVLRRKPLESPADALACLVLDRRVVSRGAREVVGQLNFRPRVPQVIEGGIGCDSPGPGAKLAGRVEAGTRAVDSPESFHGEVLCGARVAYNANDPGVDLFLVLPEQRLKASRSPAANRSRSSIWRSLL